MAFSAGFEERVIKSLCDLFPNLSEALLSISDRLVDPQKTIKANVYHKEFKGSFSLKKAAPALLGKEWSYDNLEVSDGKVAQVSHGKMLSQKCSAADKKMFKDQLLEYCKRDTLAMVELVKWIYRNCK